MKIRKVDDKPMVIHTKEKAKIHAHEPKGAKIKGSNIYTVERGPKTAGAKVTDTDRKKSYRKSTIHQSESKNKGLSRFKRNYRESNTSIKTKNTNFHIAGRTGALAAGAVTEQVEGGHEVSQAAYLAYEASRPVTGTASKGAALFRKKAAAEAKKRIKKVEAGKKLAKKTAKKAAKDTAKTVAKETAKETAKTTAKVATKTATKTAATAAGTAVAPGVGTAIGMAAGYAAGVSIEVKDEKMTNRSRKIKFFLDKMKAQENQTDSVAKLVKDLIVRKAITWVKAAAPIIGLVLLLLVLVVAMIAVPVIAVIAILYNSPFALFLPPLESGDTVQTVTSAYVQEFNRDVNTKVNEHTGYDLGELVYVDYEGMEENPSNYYDIMAVYMVKHGIGDTATVMNDISKGWLQAVVNDMCSYTTSTGTKDVEETDADGNVTTVTKSVLYVNVTLKSYRDMISVYGFNSDQVEMLEQIMSPEFMGQLGYAGSGSGGGGGRSEAGKTHMIERLPVGKYTLREESAPYGYKVASDVTFEVKETAEIQKVSMKDEQAVGKIVIEKTDKVTGKPIDGVVFEVRDKDGKVLDTLTTDKNGHAESKELPICTYNEDGSFKEDIHYTVVETKAADGYILDETAHDVTLRYDDNAPDVVVTTLKLINVPTEPKLPQTGDNANPLLYLGIGALALITGVGVGLRGRKKKNKQ